MTPQRWEAMQTAANRQDAHDWAVTVGWAAVAALGVLTAVVMVAGVIHLVMWARWEWCQRQERRAGGLFDGAQGRTWR